MGRGVSDRVWDILGVKERVPVIDPDPVRLTERVRVVVREDEGGIPMVPAKL